MRIRPIHIFASLAFLWGALAPSWLLAQQPQANLDAEINTKLPSTNRNVITASALRQVLHDFNAAVFSGSGTSATTFSAAGGYIFQVPTPSTSSGNPTIKLGSTATWPLSSYSIGQVGTLTVVDQQGVSAGMFATRTSDWNTALAPNSIAVTILNANDKTSTGPTGSWGLYLQSNKTAAAAAIEQFGAELSFQNLGASVIGDPFTVNPSGATVSLRIDSGIGPSTGNPITAAVEVLNNGNTYNTAFRVGNGALANRSSIFYAFEMPTNYSVVWFSGASTIAGLVTVDNSNIFQMSGTGGININGPIQAQSTTAIPAGGSAGVGYKFSSVANFGEFFGSGAPTLSAAQGSLYLRSDGLPYYNTNGSTGWGSLAPLASPTFTGTVTVPALSATTITASGLVTPTLGATITGAGLVVGAPTGGDKGAGTLNVQGTIWTNGTQGVASKTCTVNQNLTLIFTNGVLTGGTCNA